MLRGPALLLPALFSIVFSMAPAQEHVILLHGLCRTSASMETMAQTLTAAGYTVDNVDYPSRTASIDALAYSAIGPALASDRAQSAAQIHFVTHSLGGILVRSYFSRHTEPALGRVVMLGPPNQGSEVVDQLRTWPLFKQLNGPAGQELGTAPDSTPNTLGPATFPVGIIAGRRSINWINSLMIHGANDGKVSVNRTHLAGMADHLVLPATHPFLMKNKTALRQTVAFLRDGRFQR